MVLMWTELHGKDGLRKIWLKEIVNYWYFAPEFSVIYENMSCCSCLDHSSIVEYLKNKMKETEPDNRTKYKTEFNWILQYFVIYSRFFFSSRPKLRMMLYNLRLIFVHFQIYRQYHHQSTSNSCKKWWLF